METAEEVRACVARARERLPGYGAWLADQGWRDGDPISELPVLDKGALFRDGLRGWFPPGPIAGAVEAFTSSGHGGHLSLGLVGESAEGAVGAAVDAVLAELGASPDRPGVIVSCLPQGIRVPGAAALQVGCGTNIPSALAVLADLAPEQGPCLIVGEPLLLKELAERGYESRRFGWCPQRSVVATGGEWVAEGLRSYIERFMPPASGGVLISYGAAEIGLNTFQETHVLRAMRRALRRDPKLRAELLGQDPGIAPILLAAPEHLLLEQLPDGRCLITTRDERPMPLVRFDVGDEMAIVDPERLARTMRGCGIGVSAPAGPVIAHEGRRVAYPPVLRASRVEHVKEALFSNASWARALTGRFSLRYRRGAVSLLLELSRRATDARPPTLHELTQRGLRIDVLDFAPQGVYPHLDGHGAKARYLDMDSVGH